MRREQTLLNDDNTCPACGSKKIIAHYQFPLYVDTDIRTGKNIYKDCDGKRIYNPSNKFLATLYNSCQLDAQMWNYECEKCGWISDAYVQ